MPYIVIGNFSAGLDTRRHPMASPPGTLARCNNAHITRGGEISKRRAHIVRYTLPANATKSLAVAKSQLYVFGGGTTPSGIPAGVIYQRLQHPSSVALDRVLSYDVFDGKIYAAAQYVDGSIFHFYDGVRVTDWYDGRARCAFDVVGGTANPSNQITSITVGGVQLLSSAITHTGSNDTTATAIADAINASVTVPDYTAVGITTKVNIITADPGAAANGRVVNITVTGNFSVTPNATSMSGGVDTTALIPGTYVKTAQTKMYAVSGSLMHMSGVEQPTKWTAAAGVTGSGFINMENQDGLSEQLLALERYYSRMAVFGRRSIQVWVIDVDPAKNVQQQVLRNTGLVAPQSVEQVGDSDVYYLADSGIRSLRARDSSTAAASEDVGAPVDETVTAWMQTIGIGPSQRSVAVIEPIAGRYILAIDSTVYSFSQFPSNKIRAWSTYTPGFIISDWAVIDDDLYARSGDTIYQIGGTTGAQFDTSLVEVELPLLDADKPANFKKWSAIDLVCEGTWRIYAGFEPLNPTARQLIAEVSSPTLSMQRISLEGYGTHASIKLENNLAEAARIANFMIHYDLADVG